MSKQSIGIVLRRCAFPPNANSRHDTLRRGSQVGRRMNSSITGLCILVAASLFGPAIMVRGANHGTVAYVNDSINHGAQLIANPLSNRANRIDQVLTRMSQLPEGTRVVTFDGRNWLTNEFLQGAWTFPEITLSPGGGAVLFSPTNWIQTWVGSVVQGELKVLIPAGGSLRSSPVPLSGKLSERLLFPKVTGTKIYNVDDSGQLVLRATCTDTGWEPEEPSMLVGASFYVDAPYEFVWSRAFAGEGDSATNIAIQITKQPRNQQISLGDFLLLEVEASSTNGLRYQWQINGEDIPNATEPTLAISQAGPEHFGKYWVKIWDEYSWVWSDIAVVQATGPRLTIEQDSQRRGVLLISQGTSGRNAAIEISTDLIQWTELLGTEPIGPDTVLDRSTGPPARFYRLRLN